MKKFLEWLREKYLPEFCRLQLTEENRNLREELREANEEIRRLNSYIDGVDSGLRALRRITINNTNRKDGCA